MKLSSGAFALHAQGLGPLIKLETATVLLRTKWCAFPTPKLTLKFSLLEMAFTEVMRLQWGCVVGPSPVMTKFLGRDENGSTHMEAWQGGERARGAICKQTRRPQTQSCWHLGLHLQNLGCFCCLTHPVSGIVLWLPRQTNKGCKCWNCH